MNISDDKTPFQNDDGTWLVSFVFLGKTAVNIIGTVDARSALEGEGTRNLRWTLQALGLFSRVLEQGIAQTILYRLTARRGIIVFVVEEILEWQQYTPPESNLDLRPLEDPQLGEYAIERRLYLSLQSSSV